MTMLLIDANNLAARSFYSLPPMNNGGRRVEVAFGVLKAAKYYRDLFQTTRMVWTFDHGEQLRKAEMPCYKFKRNGNNVHTGSYRDKKFLQKQVEELKEIIPRLGFSNVLYESGYEADDIIASVAMNQESKSNIIIISSDKDLFQLLDHVDAVHDPVKKTNMTSSLFKTIYGIDPSQWPEVKAIAGCKSDNVPGINMVGEKTALDFIAGKLKPQTITYKRCMTGVKQVLQKNLSIVKLPYKGTPRYELKPDSITKGKWRAVLDSLGIQSIKA